MKNSCNNSIELNLELKNNDLYKIYTSILYKSIEEVYNAPEISIEKKRKLILSKLRNPQSLSLSEIKNISEMYDILNNKVA